MPRRARCGDCGCEVAPTRAKPHVRTSGVVLLCPSCSGEQTTKIPIKRERAKNPLLTAKAATPAPVVKRSRAQREPIPEAVALAAEAAEVAEEEEDYDAIYVSVEEDEESTDVLYPAYEIEADLPDEAEQPPNSSGGRDYASTSGAIEVNRPAGPRPDTTPPPAVVVGD